MNNIYACPSCNSSHLRLPTLISTVCRCEACGWVGTQRDLLEIKVESLVADASDATAASFSKDLFEFMAKSGIGVRLVQLCQKYRYIPADNEGAVRALYVILPRVTNAIAKIVLEYRVEIEKGKAAARGDQPAKETAS
jgi:hypothetical protein